MVNFQNYKNNKVSQIEADIKRLSEIHSEFLQEELKERNNKKPDETHIQVLAQELHQMDQGKRTDPYSPESFF